MKDIVFPNYRIKERRQIMEICIRSCRELTVTQPIQPEFLSKGHAVIYVDKMSRLFFFSENKYVSITFPVSLLVEEGKCPQFLYDNKQIDAQMWSLLVSMASTSYDEVIQSLEYYDYCSMVDGSEYLIQNLFEQFQQTDYGYLRYDCDRDAYLDAIKKGRKHSHPLHHFDIHLSNFATFKTGITEELKPNQFIEFVNNEENRWYVIPAPVAEKKKLLKHVL